MALGDRHSLTKVGNSGRIWYAGTPEPTDYNEVKPGFALVATINEEGVTTKEVNVGRWKFIEREQADLNTKEDIDALRGWLEDLEDKERRNNISNNSSPGKNRELLSNPGYSRLGNSRNRDLGKNS